MEKQACRGLEDRLGPLTYNLANVIQNPGLCKRAPKSKVRAREPSSSDSSAEKPLRKNLKMATTVKGQVAAINASTATSGENDDSDGQSNSGRTNPPGHKPANAGKKGEQFCRDFLKMNPVKKGLRDDKDERKHRNTTACHYDALADSKFVGTIHTENSLLPKMKPTEVVGIIMAHYSYRDSFIEAIIKDSEPFCLSKTDTLGGNLS